MRERKFLSALIAAALVIGVIGPSRAIAQEKTQLQFVSLPVGALTNLASTAIAGLVSKKTSYTATVTPYAGPQVYIPMLDRGEASFAIFSVTDARMAFQGITPTYRQPNRNLRLVSVAFENRVGGMVTVKSGLTSKDQLRGKRIASSFPAHQSCFEIATALLANYGMGWKDFVEVPVQSAVPAVTALGDGRVEFNPCGAFGLPVNREVNVRTPLRFIAVDPGPDAVKRAHDVFPGVRAVLAKANSAEGVLEDTHVFGFDFYFVANADVPDDAVYAVVKTVWESLPELRQAHPAFNLWTQERMAGADVVALPYHPGAIKLLKEKGAWTDAIERANARRLAAQ